jgi:Protein of unknown function (DUF1194)
MVLRLLALVFVGILGASTASAGEAPVDLELVLAVDVSGSMDSDEQELQRAGYVEAFRDPDVMTAIAAGVHGKIAVTYVEWAGPANQTIIVPWRVIDGPEAGMRFADKLAAAPISRFRGTSISGSLAFAAPIFDANGFAGLRRVIDISGDGPNNMGEPVLIARALVIASGVTINGLPIMIKKPNGFYSIPALDAYYEDCVIGGPGAFLVVVQSKEMFASAIRRKLVLEIAGSTPLVIPAGETLKTPRSDCLIGEKLREQWMRE